MARHHDALHLLRSIEPILADGLVDCPEGWRRLIDALTFDLSTQQQLRSAERLADHAFWQLGAEGSRGTPESAPATQIAEDLGSLGQRLRYLLRMREALDGNRSALLDLAGHLRWASEQGLTGYERSLRLEIAATALALGATPIAENMLEPLHKVESNFTGHRELEYLYCAAKIRQIQSRQIEAQQLYSRYALVAMRNLYEIADVRTSFAKRSTKSAAQSDDISIRLPARYRRAYQHMLDNLSRRDLTVREIAAKIDVSERALQNVFRSCLGLSPAEVLRRKRMEGVRMELFDESEASRKRVKEAAVRWGLSRRSILVNGYSCDADDLQTKCDETQPESRARHGKSAMGSE
jgi:AraC-like DNA-binding protein